MSEIAAPEPLTFEDVIELDLLEARIESGYKTFRDVADALVRIRDGRLYREQYTTFEEYCVGRWDMGRGYANRVIRAAETYKRLVPIVTKDELPRNEGQARALQEFDADLQPAIMRVAAAQAEGMGKPLSASLIKSVGNTLTEATVTGHVDTGSGESTAFDAAIVASSYEDTMRQKQHIEEAYKHKDARQQWQDTDEIKVLRAACRDLIDVAREKDWAKAHGALDRVYKLTWRCIDGTE